MDLLRQGLNVAKRELDAYVPGATTKIKNIADKAKALAMSMSELEMKVMEATNHEPWGPHGKDMQGESRCLGRGGEWGCCLAPKAGAGARVARPRARAGRRGRSSAAVGLFILAAGARL
jgi:hypothetical protein